MIVLREFCIRNPHRLVNMKGNQVVGSTEKPTYSSMIKNSLYILNSSTSEIISNNFCILPKIIESAVDNRAKVSF